MPPGRPTTLPEPWRSLALRLGGVGRLADALGTVPTTIRRWAIGERLPSRSAWMLIQECFGLAGLSPPLLGMAPEAPDGGPLMFIEEIRAGLEAFALQAGQRGPLAKIRAADALARVEAAGIAMERAGYAAHSRLAAGGSAMDRRHASMLAQALESPIADSLAPQAVTHVSARLKRVLRDLEWRRMEVLALLVNAPSRK